MRVKGLILRLPFCTIALTLSFMAAPASSAQTKKATAELTVGATLIGSLEALETTSERGEPVLLLNSTSGAVLTADKGVAVVEENGSWSATATATATAGSTGPLYVTLTY